MTGGLLGNCMLSRSQSWTYGKRTSEIPVKDSRSFQTQFWQALHDRPATCSAVQQAR